MIIRIPSLNISLKYFERPEGWIGCILVFNCVYKALINFLRMPAAINYFNDALCMLLLYAVTISYQKNGIKSAKVPFKIFSILLLETLFGYLLNVYNPLIYIWGLRTLFRYFIFFFACTLFVKRNSIKNTLDFFYKILFVNLIFSTLEYMMGYGLDSVTGLYSAGLNERGGSAALNVLMCVVCTYSVIQYFNKKCSLPKMILPILASVYMSAIGEIKVFYFELVLIFALCTVFTKFSWKKFVGIFGGGALLVIGLSFYNRYYGDRGNFFTLDAALTYAGTDGTTYGQAALNRTTALPYMWENFLADPIKKLFGLGLGYADTVNFSAFSSGFGKEYSYLGYQYWLASLELTNIGLIGLLFLVLFFISVLFYCTKRKKVDKDNGIYYSLVQVIVCLSFIWFFYNQGLIIDISAFMVYWILAIPYILANTEPKAGRVL